MQRLNEKKKEDKRHSFGSVLESEWYGSTVTLGYTQVSTYSTGGGEESGCGETLSAGGTTRFPRQAVADYIPKTLIWLQFCFGSFSFDNKATCFLHIIARSLS